ncbi:uncharacterized protein LOC111386636 [Olea europaea var. sylvestris]|uniref:uncharacterized protein LOC111386636 n=1 Tax=Olea europaea var. sylvestris TaxID=158386 RepID=UPI000C1D3983|nr:uncharacterized protein LOC111386636 [Olea europaea var. sylvestris]
MENIENALPGIRSKLDQFQLKDIYNMDETELFYRLKADHSLATKQLEGRKKNKEIITVVVCCNGDESDKVPHWVIGKYANPKYFKYVNMNNLNCKYQSNKKAWMTGLLFQDFFGCFDKRMNGRKVLLIVDNCSAHPKHCKIRSEENNVPEPEVDELDKGIQRLNDVISNLHYKNVMDVEHLLNYPSENDAVIESPTYEEIIQSVMNSNDDENDPEPDDSSVVPNVSSKEAFQLVPPGKKKRPLCQDQVEQILIESLAKMIRLVTWFKSRGTCKATSLDIANTTPV